MIQEQRVLFSDNGTISDLSINLNNFREGSETVDFVSAEDYIYVGSFLPFNHKHFDLSTVNDQASVVSVSIWDGAQWRAAVDVIDRTAVSGVSLAQDGIISWSPDPDLSGWNREEKSTNVTGLSGTKIFNFYWARFGWSADWKATTAIDFIGNKFSSDTDLYDEYPDLNNSSLKDSFESGKTDWEEQNYIAANKVIFELKKDRTIITPDQLMDWEIFQRASVHAAAMIIYWGLGIYEKHDKAKLKFQELMEPGYFNVDTDSDGELDLRERTAQRYLSR